MNPISVVLDALEFLMYPGKDHGIDFILGSLFISGSYFHGYNLIQVYFDGCWNAARRPNVEDFIEQLTWTLVHELCHKLGGWEHPDMEIENFL